jgi:hypothetical protein
MKQSKSTHIIKDIYLYLSFHIVNPPFRHPPPPRAQNPPAPPFQTSHANIIRLTERAQEVLMSENYG